MEKKLLLLYVYPVIIGDNTIDGILIYVTPLLIINEQKGEIELLITLVLKVLYSLD